MVIKNAKQHKDYLDKVFASENDKTIFEDISESNIEF